MADWQKVILLTVSPECRQTEEDMLEAKHL